MTTTRDDLRILHLEPGCYPADAREALENIGSVVYLDGVQPDQLPTLLAAAPYDAVFCRIGLPVDVAAMDAAPTLRWVVTPTTGLDHIDLAAAAERGVEVLSLKGHVHLLDTVAATAELTWALVLAVVRRLPAAQASVQAGAWVRTPFVGTELRGRTLGVIGYGRLGRMVADFGVAFGMRVLVHDHDPAQLERAHGPIEPIGLHELLAEADIVSLHLPLDASTVGFLGRDRLESTRPGAVLVNTARGELIDDDAVIELLRQGHLGGFGADVVADDSVWPATVPAGQPLVALASELDNVVITPHMGGYARDAIETTRRFIAQEFVRRATATGPQGDDR